MFWDEAHRTVAMKTKDLLKYRERYARWLQEPLGQTFLETEKDLLKGTIGKLFGYHFLLLGEADFAQSISKSPILHRVWVHSHAKPQARLSAIRGRFDKLPIIADEIDLVYAAHCLELIRNPHEVLREIYRVLRPEGHLIISCFNSPSLFGFWKWICAWISPVAFHGKYMSAYRLKDWLILLGFDIVETKYFFYRPPVNSQKVLSKLKWLEYLGKMCWPFLGSGYYVLAKKRVLTLTPIRPYFAKNSALAQDLEPSLRMK